MLLRHFHNIIEFGETLVDRAIDVALAECLRGCAKNRDLFSADGQCLLKTLEIGRQYRVADVWLSLDALHHFFRVGHLAIVAAASVSRSIAQGTSALVAHLRN